MTDNVFWVLQLNVNEGKLDELKSLAAEMCESTKNEEGALVYEWFLDADEKTCRIYERYADSAAVMVHMGNFGANFAERFLGVVTPVAFDVYGPADDTVRETLAAFSPSYHAQFDGFVR